MQWISSDGGPLILVGRSALSKWLGIDSADYERACLVEEYVGVLDVGRSKAIALGDEPGQTSSFVDDSENILLVRWVYAENDASVSAHLKHLPRDVFDTQSEEIKFHASENRYFLFDSAENGTSAVGLVLTLPATNYLIKTIAYKPDAKTSLLLHKFEASKF